MESPLTNILTSQKHQSAVSSVLMKNHKEFGKKHIFDGKEDTCWNSDQGLPQYVSIKFEEPQKIKEIRFLS